MGVVKATETMGVAEGQAQRDGVNTEQVSGFSVCVCHTVIYCSREQLIFI